MQNKYHIGDTVIVVTDNYGITVRGSIGIVTDLYGEDITILFNNIGVRADELYEFTIDIRNIELLKRRKQYCSHQYIALKPKNKPHMGDSHET